jgi:hypothetical protein
MASPFIRHPPVDQPIETEFCANWHRLQGRASSSSGFGASPMSLSARVVFIVVSYCVCYSQFASINFGSSCWAVAKACGLPPGTAGRSPAHRSPLTGNLFPRTNPASSRRVTSTCPAIQEETKIPARCARQRITLLPSALPAQETCQPGRPHHPHTCAARGRSFRWGPAGSWCLPPCPWCHGSGGA